MFPVLYSANEPEHFLGFFTSWIRIWIRICPCRSVSGSRTGGISLCGSMWIRIHIRIRNTAFFPEAILLPVSVRMNTVYFEVALPCRNQPRPALSSPQVSSNIGKTRFRKGSYLGKGSQLGKGQIQGRPYHVKVSVMFWEGSFLGKV